MLSVVHTYRRLVLTRAGGLYPWLGPAVRGLAGARLKGRFCVHGPAEQQGRWRFCKGCPHQVGCAYGETLEGTSPQAATLFKGQEDGLRPVVVAAAFPGPGRAGRGAEVPVRATFVGRTAAGWAGEFWSALAGAGRDLSAGLDPADTPFRVEPLHEDVAGEVRLPSGPEAVPGVVGRLRVRLTGPLFLREEVSRGEHRLIRRPRFADLLRACLRTLGGLHVLYGERLAADFASLKDAAERVRLVRADYRDFRQPKWSRRGGQKGTFHGIAGWGEYADVSCALIPWLAWGGALHVGAHRVAGAGGWEVEV